MKHLQALLQGVATLFRVIQTVRVIWRAERRALPRLLPRI
jgi:hypothetical protein